MYQSKARSDTGIARRDWSLSDHRNGETAVQRVVPSTTARLLSAWLACDYAANQSRCFQCGKLNRALFRSADCQRPGTMVGSAYGTKVARGTAILPIAPWSVPNQIKRVDLSNVIWRMVFGPGFPTGISATNFFVFGSNATSVAGTGG